MKCSIDTVASHPKACVLFFNSAVNDNDSQANKNMEMARERTSFTFDPRDMILSLQMGFSFETMASNSFAVSESVSTIHNRMDVKKCFQYSYPHR